MKRRTLIGVIAGSLGSAAIVGSGAYNITRAERELEVEVVPDADAYLSIAPHGSGGRSSGGYADGDEVVVFRFPGPNSQEHPLDDPPNGLGSDSVYEFTRDKDPDNPDGLAVVTNQGTQTVQVVDEPEDTDGPNVGLFDIQADPKSNGLRPLLRDEPVILNPGESFEIGIQIDTHGVEIGGGDEEDGAYLESVRFVANAKDES